jgi:hypothetical protein
MVFLAKIKPVWAHRLSPPELGGQLVQSSVYATGVGLLMAGRDKYLKELEKQPVRRKGIDTDGFLAKLKAWLERNF